MTLTSRLMVAGCAQLSPLCPGSTTITFPASGRRGAVALAEGALAGEPAPPLGPVAAPFPAAAPPGAGAGAPEHAASRPARAPAAARAAAARTRRCPAAGKLRDALPGRHDRLEILQARPNIQLNGN